jgi:hypothetical protein
MRCLEPSSRVPVKSAMLALTALLATAVLTVAIVLLSAPHAAQATQQFATQTGLPCSQCHADLNAPMNLTDFGKAFLANGNKVPAGK